MRDDEIEKGRYPTRAAALLNAHRERERDLRELEAKRKWDAIEDREEDLMQDVIKEAKRVNVRSNADRLDLERQAEEARRDEAAAGYAASADWDAYDETGIKLSLTARQTRVRR
jgi:hypothetical protein